MSQQTYILQLEGVQKSEANKLAKELEPILKNSTSEATIASGQSEPGNQDFGATLVIGILSAPAIIELSKKIGDWLLKRTGCTITIKAKDGDELVVENMKRNDAKALSDKWIDNYEKKK